MFDCVLDDLIERLALKVYESGWKFDQVLCLARGGVRDIVVNTAWLEAQFPAALGDGHRFGLTTLHYSHEAAAYGGALEPAGGVATGPVPALPDSDNPFQENAPIMASLPSRPRAAACSSRTSLRS